MESERDPRLIANDGRVLGWLNGILNAPLPKPRDPHRMRAVWVLVGFCAGALAVVLFIIVPPVFS